MVTLDEGGRAREKTVLIAAPADLAHVVEHAFIRGGGACARAGWRVVPDPSAHLVLVFTAASHGRLARAAVVGARSTFAEVDAANRRLTVGVRFRPGALAAITRETAGAFTDRAFAVDDVFGSSWRRVAERLTDRAPHATVRELFGLVRSRRTGPLDATLFTAARHATSVAEIAARLAVPLRTLHQHSWDTVGLRPKRLLRVLRLHRALEACQRPLGWAAVAASTGFADQAHLAREVRALLGEPPSRWLARGATAADSFKTAAAGRR